MKTVFRFLLAAWMLSACSPSPKDRALSFDGIVNARELGGLVMQDGRTVRSGKLVRSGELSKASDADVAHLKSRFGLSDVFDFRFDRERSSAPDREMEGVTNTWLSTLPQSFMTGFSAGRTDTAKIQSSDMLEALAKYAFDPRAQQMAAKLYPAIVMDTLSQKRYGMFLKGVLDAKGGALWHCSQGKDRCGWGSAFVLAALDASRETIVEDFALSNVSYAQAIEALSDKIVAQGGSDAELSFLEKALGFTPREQEQFRNKYLK